MTKLILTTISANEAHELAVSLEMATTSVKCCTIDEKLTELATLKRVIDKVVNMGEIKCRSSKKLSNLMDYLRYANTAFLKGCETLERHWQKEDQKF